MVLQGEVAEDEEDVAAPLREIGGLQVQNEGNEVPDVLDGGSLVVELGDGRGVGESSSRGSELRRQPRRVAARCSRV
jgi:hypothetical protein